MTINDSHINPEMTFRKLVFLNMQQLTNFPYIEKDFDALTDYQLLCKVVEYLNIVIKNSNDQNDSITNLYNAFISLQDYVNTNFDDLETAFNNLQTFVTNYFDNLDVQEEINNKLDDMLEDGVLTEIIQQFLQSTAIWCFDTVADMKLATNLINGSYAQTLGYYSINDGGGALYKITNTESSTEIQEQAGNLYATLIPENKKINVLQYGAISSNETDYTSKIQKVIDFAENKGILVEFNPVTYYVSALKFKCNIEGNNCTFKCGYFSTSNKVAINYGKSNIYCKNYIVDGEQFGSNPNVRTDIRDVENITIENVEVKNFIDTSSRNAWGILITRAQNINLINCKGENCTQSTIAIVENTLVNIERCNIEKINIEPNNATDLVITNVNNSIIDEFTVIGNTKLRLYIMCNITNSKINNFNPRSCLLNMSNVNMKNYTNYSTFGAGSVRGNIESCFTIGPELNINPTFKDVWNGTSLDNTKGYHLHYSPVALTSNLANETVNGVGTLLTLNPNQNSYIVLKTNKYSITENKYYMVKFKYIAESNQSNNLVGELIRLYFFKYENEQYTELENSTYQSGFIQANENTGIQEDYVIVQAPSDSTHLEVKFGQSGGNSSEKYQLIELNINQIEIKKSNFIEI